MKNIKLADFTSDNGYRSLQFGQNRGLQLINTHFSSRGRHEGTHYGAKSKKWRRVVYIATSARFRSNTIRKCRAYTGFSLQAGKEERSAWTDHNPVIMGLNWLTKIEIRRKLNRKRKKTGAEIQFNTPPGS